MITSGTHYDYECHVCGSKARVDGHRSLPDGWAAFVLVRSVTYRSTIWDFKQHDSPALEGIDKTASKCLCPGCRGPYDDAVKALEVLVSLRDNPEKFKETDDPPLMTLEESKEALFELKAHNQNWTKKESLERLREFSKMSQEDKNIYSEIGKPKEPKDD